MEKKTDVWRESIIIRRGIIIGHVLPESASPNSEKSPEIRWMCFELLSDTQCMEIMSVVSKEPPQADAVAHVRYDRSGRFSVAECRDGLRGISTQFEPHWNCAHETIVAALARGFNLNTRTHQLETMYYGIVSTENS